jgi:hypothetical protein
MAQNQTLEKKFRKIILEILYSLFPGKLNTCILLIEIIRAIDKRFWKSMFLENAIKETRDGNCEMRNAKCK